MEQIKPNEIYNSKEARGFLKISESTIKRWLKQGIIRANKIGGRYKIIGSELLRLISPKTETKSIKLYRRIKNKTKQVIKNW